MVRRDVLSPVAAILRRRGFIPLPRLWVKPSDMPKIHRITRQYRDEVNSVRAEVNAEETRIATESFADAVEAADPMTDKDAAWEAAERLRAAEGRF